MLGALADGCVFTKNDRMLTTVKILAYGRVKD